MLKFVDSFDHYATGNILSKWTQQQATAISGAAGRNGNGLLIGAGGGISKTLGLQSSFVIGFAYKLNLSGGSVNGNPYTLYAVTTSRTLQSLCEFAILPDMTPAIFAFNNLIINPKSFIFSGGTWNYIELTINLSGALTVNVTANLHINGQFLGGASADSLVSLGSLLSGLAKANFHNFSAPGSGVGSCFLDDLYICDQEGGINNTFLGDVKIGCIYPRQDVLTQWAPSAGSAHFSLVNEHVPDDDTTFIFDNTVSHIDSFYFDTVTSFSGQILGAQLNIYARKNDEGSRALRDEINAGAFVGANDIYLGDNYSYHTVPYDTLPGDVSFTPALINATDFGVKLTV